MTVLDSYDISNRNTYGGLSAYPANLGAYYMSYITLNDGQNYKLTSIAVPLAKQAGSVCTFQVEVYAHTGTYGTTSAPTGSALATSDVLSESDIGTGWAMISFPFSGAQQITLSPNTHYVLVVKCLTTNVYNPSIGIDSSSPTHAGNAGTWTSA